MFYVLFFIFMFYVLFFIFSFMFYFGLILYVSYFIISPHLHTRSFACIWALSSNNVISANKAWWTNYRGPVIWRRPGAPYVANCFVCLDTVDCMNQTFQIKLVTLQSIFPIYCKDSAGPPPAVGPETFF